MRLFIDGLDVLFKWIFFPFLLLGKTFGLLLFSMLIGIGLLALFKKVSNQGAIQRVKNRISGHILELRLYQDDLSLTLKAIGRTFYNNLLYLRTVLLPMLIFILPVLLILIQLSKIYEYSPFRPDQSMMLSAEVMPFVSIQKVTLETPESVFQEIPPVRIISQNQIYWRLRARQQGIWQLKFHYDNQTEIIKLYVGIRTDRLAPVQMKSRLAALFHPVDKTLPADSFLTNVHIQYPSATFSIFGIKIHWLIFFFIISVATGFVFKNPLGVEL